MRTPIRTIPRFRHNPDLSREFAKFTRRILTPREKQIIHALESQRIHNGQIRFIITDRPGQNSRPLLLDYINYLQNHIHPSRPVPSPPNHYSLPTHHLKSCHPATPVAVIVSATPSQPPVSNFQIPITGPRYRHYLRGRNFNIALILDVQQYPRKFPDILRAVLPAISQTPLSTLIIHTYNSGNNRLKKNRDPFRGHHLNPDAYPSALPPFLPAVQPLPPILKFQFPILPAPTTFSLLTTTYYLKNSPPPIFNFPAIAAVTPARVNPPNRCQANLDILAIPPPGSVILRIARVYSLLTKKARAANPGWIRRSRFFRG